MVFISNKFKAECKDIGNGNFLHLIDIENIDSQLESFIDASIVKICEGNTSTDLKTIKIRLKEYLSSKKGTTLEIGSIAEFFTHLYLNEIGFKQECLFLHLEEGGAIKKGFDGYYSLNSEEWIYESKSGSINTQGISHQGKIREAYNGIKNKVSGNTKNNPWQNAYNHASHIDVGSDLSIRHNLKKLSDDFINKRYYEIKDFNIMPGSTIFLEGNWESIKSPELENKIKALVKELDYKKINVICVNKKSIELFLDYLKK